MTKKELRTQYLTKRLQLTVNEYAIFNRQLLSHFQQLDLTGVNCIHLFLPITERNEPDTRLIRDWLKIHHPAIKIVYPQTNFQTLTMESFADDADLHIELNGYGIPEPVAGNIVPINEIDMVLLPLLIFDEPGYRVGYGKGFYDRFIAQCKPGTRFVGVSFFEPVKQIADIDGFDIRMHICLTPTKKWMWD